MADTDTSKSGDQKGDGKVDGLETSTYVLIGNTRIGNHRYSTGDKVEIDKEHAEKLVKAGALVTESEWAEHPKNPEAEVNNLPPRFAPVDHPVQSGGDGTDSLPGSQEHPSTGSREAANSGEGKSGQTTVQNSQDGNRVTGKEPKSK